MCTELCNRNSPTYSAWRCISCVGIEVARQLEIIKPGEHEGKTDILDIWEATEFEDLRDELTSAPYLSQSEMLTKAADSFRRAGLANIGLELSRMVLQDENATLISPLVISQAVRSHALALKALGKTLEAEDMLNVARYLHQSDAANRQLGGRG